MKSDIETKEPLSHSLQIPLELTFLELGAGGAAYITAQVLLHIKTLSYLLSTILLFQ